jgi:hypothetical protein
LDSFVRGSLCQKQGPIQDEKIKKGRAEFSISTWATEAKSSPAAYSSDVDQGSWMMPISVPAIPIKVGAQRRWRA